MLSIRPSVADLSFQVFSRSVHPELFRVLRSLTVSRSTYTARIDITTTGHVVTFNHQSVTLTEVAGSALHPLPQRRRLHQSRVHGKRCESFAVPLGVGYRTEYELERVEPATFWMYQRELARQSPDHPLLQCFESSGRMDVGAVSYVHHEVRQRSLLLQVIHTFPDDHALMKSLSVFSIAGPEASGG